MSKRVKKYLPTLQLLAKCDKHTANSVVKSAKPEFLSCVSDICHNILQDRVKLSPKEKQKLFKYKQQIRKIAKKSTTQKSKRELIQKGGFLAAILGPLLGSIIGPIAKGFTKA